MAVTTERGRKIREAHLAKTVEERQAITRKAQETRLRNQMANNPRRGRPKKVVTIPAVVANESVKPRAPRRTNVDRVDENTFVVGGITVTRKGNRWNAVVPISINGSLDTVIQRILDTVTK